MNYNGFGVVIHVATQPLIILLFLLKSRHFDSVFFSSPWTTALKNNIKGRKSVKQKKTSQIVVLLSPRAKENERKRPCIVAIVLVGATVFIYSFTHAHFLPLLYLPLSLSLSLSLVAVESVRGAATYQIEINRRQRGETRERSPLTPPRDQEA